MRGALGLHRLVSGVMGMSVSAGKWILRRLYRHTTVLVYNYNSIIVSCVKYTGIRVLYFRAVMRVCRSDTGGFLQHGVFSGCFYYGTGCVLPVRYYRGLHMFLGRFGLIVTVFLFGYVVYVNWGW